MVVLSGAATLFVYARTRGAPAKVELPLDVVGLLKPRFAGFLANQVVGIAYESYGFGLALAGHSVGLR